MQSIVGSWNCDRANDALGLTSKEGGTAAMSQLKNSKFQTVMFCTCMRGLRQGLT